MGAVGEDEGVLDDRHQDVLHRLAVAGVAHDQFDLGVEVEAPRTLSAGNRWAPSKQLTATVNGMPRRSK